MLKKYCSQCARGDSKVEAVFKVRGLSDQRRPYQSWLCEGHYDMLADDGWSLDIVSYADPSSPEAIDLRSASLWARYEIAKGAYKRLRSAGDARWPIYQGQAFKLHDQWLKIQPEGI